MERRISESKSILSKSRTLFLKTKNKIKNFRERRLTTFGSRLRKRYRRWDTFSRTRSKCRRIWRGNSASACGRSSPTTSIRVSRTSKRAKCTSFPLFIVTPASLLSHVSLFGLFCTLFFLYYIRTFVHILVYCCLVCNTSRRSGFPTTLFSAGCWIYRSRVNKR